MAYLNLHLLYPKKTEKIKANIPASLRQRLVKEEVERIGPILQAQELAQRKMQGKAQANSAGIVSSNSANGINNGSHLSTTAVGGNNAVPATEPADPEALVTISPVKIANLRARRMSCEDSAVASIQALIRGRKSRRQTMSMQISGDSECGGSIHNSPDRRDSKNDSLTSPSLTSRAPFSGQDVTSSPGKKNGKKKSSISGWRNESIRETDPPDDFDVENETNLLGLLKVKTSMIMNLFHEQLTLIEEIENERNNPQIDTEKSLTGTRSKMEIIVERSLRISSTEIDISSEFQKRIIKLMR